MSFCRFIPVYRYVEVSETYTAGIARIKRVRRSVHGMATATTDQVEFTTTPKTVGFAQVGINMLGCVGELEAQMQRMIKRDMLIVVNRNAYFGEVSGEVHRTHNLQYVEYEWTTLPHIELIPTRRLSHDIRCTTLTCKVAHTKTTTISTTHSLNAGLPAEVGAKPFGVGVQFTGSVGYGFSRTNEESTAFTYGFDVIRGDSGYIAVVNAQISAHGHIKGCKWGKRRTKNGCDHGPWDFDKRGFHESVIMEGNMPRSIIAFIYN